MKRFVWSALALGCLLLCSAPARASWGQLGYSGYQPWWNLFAKRYKCLTPEEARLQKFWHDYYHALKVYYCHLDAIDWVAYYKNHGYQINGSGCGPAGGCCGRINYAPVVVTPGITWAIPSQGVIQPAGGCGVGGCPPGSGYGPPPGYGAAPGMMPPPGYGAAPGMMPPPGYGGAPGMMMPPGAGNVMMAPPGSGY
jgi:hypothetical protein